MKEESLHVLVGAAVIAGGLLLGSLWMGSETKTATAEGYSLTATFSKMDGLGVGSEVLLAGIPIGEVVSEEMDRETHQVVLGMRIYSSIELPIDSSARVTSDGIFGAKYISIGVGGDFDILQDGDAFEFVRDSIIFEEIFEQVIKMGEKGLEKRKAAAKAANQVPASNPFATDDDLFDDSFEENAPSEEGGTPQQTDIFDDEGPV